MTVTNAEKMNKSDNKKVILGLSGGVDSTAAALLLKDKGFDVKGLYFNVLNEREECNRDLIAKARAKAERAAQQLGIALIYRDVYESFDELIVEQFCSEYMCGRTPSPCIICNPLVKFKTLIDAADELGAEYIATGHYAKVGRYGESFCIKKATNLPKDQSYMLYRLGQNVLKRLILPLGEMENKDQVRSIAKAAGLDNAQDSDSQEICFIDDAIGHGEFIRNRILGAPEDGDYVDAQGNILGRHRGIINYTIGQRKGLGIALGKPAFVTAIDATSNRVVLGDNEELFKRQVISDSNVLLPEITEKILCKSIDVFAKIRYGARAAEAVISMDSGGQISAVFKEPQRAPTPGQSIVFYEDDLVIGGGIIEGAKA